MAQVKNPNYNPLDPNSKRFITTDEAVREADNKAGNINELFSPFTELAGGLKPKSGADFFDLSRFQLPSQQNPLQSQLTPEQIAKIQGKEVVPTDTGMGQDQTVEKPITETITTGEEKPVGTGTIGTGGEAGAGGTITPTGTLPLTGNEKTDKSIQALAISAGKAGLSLKDFMDTILPSVSQPTADESEAIRNKLGIPNLIDETFGRPPQETVEKYRELYDLSGLNTVKEDIKRVNDEITQKRNDLVKATGELKSNPWISQGTRRGRLADLQQLAYADINNSLKEKEQYLSLYDAGVDEIEAEIARVISDDKAGKEATIEELNFLLTEAEREEELIERRTLGDGLRFVPEFLKGVEQREATEFERGLQEIRTKEAVKTTGEGSVQSRIQALDPSSADYINQVIKASSGGKALTGDSIKQMKKSVTVLGQVDDLLAQISETNTGPILGILRSNNPYDVTAQLINSQLTSIIPNLARGVYGEVGVLTDRDVELYRKTLPNLKSTNQLSEMLTAMTLRVIVRGLEDQFEIEAGAGRDVSGLENVYNRVQAKASEIENKLGIDIGSENRTKTPIEKEATTNYLDTLDLEEA